MGRSIHHVRRRGDGQWGEADRLRDLLSDHCEGGDRAGWQCPCRGGVDPPHGLYSYVLDGHPAIVWVADEWVAAVRSDYTAFDGTTVPYAGPVEHSVTVSGVSPTSVLVNDPDAGRYWIPKSTFESVYQTYNQMAVVLA